MIFHFIFRAKESTCNLLQRDMVVGMTNEPPWPFWTVFEPKLQVTGKPSSRRNEQWQQNRISTDDKLIELYQQYLQLLPSDQRGSNHYVSNHQPKKRSYQGFFFLASWAYEPVWFKETKCGKNEFGPYLKSMRGEAQIPGHFTNQGIRQSAISTMTSKGVQVILFWYVLSDSLSIFYNLHI